MGEAYSNKSVRSKAAVLAKPDRTFTLIDGVVEHVLTISVHTEQGGNVCIALSLELITSDGEVCSSELIGAYLLSDRVGAQSDAVTLARRWGLSVRRATPGGGWVWIRNVVSGTEAWPEPMVIEW